MAPAAATEGRGRGAYAGAESELGALDAAREGRSRSIPSPRRPAPPRGSLLLLRRPLLKVLGSWGRVPFSRNKTSAVFVIRPSRG